MPGGGRGQEDPAEGGAGGSKYEWADRRGVSPACGPLNIVVFDTKCLASCAACEAGTDDPMINRPYRVFDRVRLGAAR